jgi:hypothetical protein
VTKYVYVVVAYDSWREVETPRPVCAYLSEVAAREHEHNASHYAAQFGSRMNFPFDSPFDPESKSQCLCRAPWYDVVNVELKGL